MRSTVNHALSESPESAARNLITPWEGIQGVQGLAFASEFQGDSARVLVPLDDFIDTFLSPSRASNWCQVQSSTMRLLKSLGVRLGGARSLLFLGDSLVIDRWRWIRKHLPRDSMLLVDAGCGNGWLAINCARLGHQTLGLGSNESDIARARVRAEVLRSNARFEVQDLRELAGRDDLKASFDVVTCTEVIEHILDDSGLISDLAALLRPGGRLLLTTPNADYVPVDDGDAGPFVAVEDGRHVRKGYSADELREIAESASLRVEEISYCSGRESQRLTRLLRRLTRSIGYGPAWALTLPLRVLPLTIERPTPDYPPYTICIEAFKK